LQTGGEFKRDWAGIGARKRFNAANYRKMLLELQQDKDMP